MRKHVAPPQERRTMGLRWGTIRRRPATSRNDHIHLFSTENNACRLRAAIQELDEGRGHRMTIEEFSSRFGLGDL